MTQAEDKKERKKDGNLKEGKGEREVKTVRRRERGSQALSGRMPGLVRCLDSGWQRERVHPARNQSVRQLDFAKKRKKLRHHQGPVLTVPASFACPRC